MNFASGRGVCKGSHDVSVRGLVAAASTYQHWQARHIGVKWDVCKDPMVQQGPRCRLLCLTYIHVGRVFCSRRHEAGPTVVVDWLVVPSTMNGRTETGTAGSGIVGLDRRKSTRKQ